MKLKKRSTWLLCLGLLAGLFAAPVLSVSAETCPQDMEDNVITASDMGGGELSRGERIALYILAGVGVFWTVFFIFGMILAAGMN
jgi:hypothetical protein